MDWLYKTRDSIIHFVYIWALRPVLFLFDPEGVHDFFLKYGSILGHFKITRWKTEFLFGYKNSKLEQKILGINFKNPVGLAAGFDKDIDLTDIISSVGFGFEEVGSVTADSCQGNPKPRLWRLPKTKSLAVWYGLKNAGADTLAEKLLKKAHRLPIGVNIAFTNKEENSDISKAVSDYLYGIKKMEKYADYLTVNLSCPNTNHGTPFLESQNYERLLLEMDGLNLAKPVFLKISPDMSFEEIDLFLSNLEKHKIQGIICSNLTKKLRREEIQDKIPLHGGLSGKPVYQKALNLLSYMYKKTGDKYVYIFCGGVFSAEDAYRAIKQGASLVQLITGMIYEGPQLISEINVGLVQRLSSDGYKNISEVIGIDNK